MNKYSATDYGYDDEAHARILDQVGVAVITIDSEGHILDTNVFAEIIFGFSKVDMQGQNVSMLMPRDHARHHDGYRQHHRSTGEKRMIGKQRHGKGKKADGTVFPMHLAVGRLEVGDQIYFKEIIRDLSVRKRLQNQATRLGQIVDESVNEIFVFKTDTLNFTLANRGAVKNQGYSTEEFAQLTPVDIKPQFTALTFRDLVAPLLSGELDRLNF